MELTDAIQDYLKEIYKLEAAGRRATTSALAEVLEVSPPSVTAMLKKLATLGLVEHERYHGAKLTESGERVALEVIRHHRLLEQYLVETLGLTIDAVHAEADRLEHALSEELEAHIDRTLGFPTRSARRSIPDAKLRVAAQDLTPLSTLEAVRRRRGARPGRRRRAASLPLEAQADAGQPARGAGVSALRRPADRAGRGADHAISRELAAQISVASVREVEARRRLRISASSQASARVGRRQNSRVLGGR